MTPQQISDYKLKWMLLENNYMAVIHIDVSDKCKDWCKENLDKQSWIFGKWYGSYQHVIHFEKETVLANFQDNHTEYSEETIHYVQS
tara:strand:- start:42 stop:302 length:261 start_codon:yes stop_codon:yes gene_type:complete